MSTILIIDDEEKLRVLLSRIIEFEGFSTLQAADGKSAWKKLAQAPVDVVLCDVKLPDFHGVELARQIKEKYHPVEVILMTAYGNIQDGVQAIKNGAFDYLIKGDDQDKLIPLLHRALDKNALARRVQLLERQLTDQYSFSSILGSSGAIRAAVDLAAKVAETDATVLLTGETGTGKEVFAQAIHQNSKRNKHRFLALNCSAFGKDLLESEMFGHKAGSFTGAVKDQKGLFEEAVNGTIFLDEIGEMAPDLQAKLLRVLETGEFIKIGETTPTKVNVRVIAATNRNLQEEIGKGHFREDLYYRISVFQIHLPPLRERTGDIALLAQHFLTHFAHKTSKRIRHISPEAMEALQQHPWKGNIRELRNVMERAVILADHDEITSDLLPADLIQPESTPKDKLLSAFSLASAEKLHIRKVMNHTNGNKTKTAELLGIALTTLYRKLAEYDIE